MVLSQPTTAPTHPLASHEPDEQQDLYHKKGSMPGRVRLAAGYAALRTERQFSADETAPAALSSLDITLNSIPHAVGKLWKLLCYLASRHSFDGNEMPTVGYAPICQSDDASSYSWRYFAAKLFQRIRWGFSHLISRFGEERSREVEAGGEAYMLCGVECHGS